VVFGVAAAALALAAPVFGAPQPVAQIPFTGGYSDEIACADFTGDGAPDCVVASQIQALTTQPITILQGNGKGGFTNVTSTIFTNDIPHVQHARQMVLADFNRDGRPDILIADHGYDAPPFPGYQNTLVLTAPGGKLVDATANLPQQYDYSHSAAAADVNGDGAPDIYVGNLNSGPSSPPPAILLNDGTGHFTPLSGALPDFMTTTYPNRRFTRETFADVDGDGDQDLVLLSEGDANGITWGPPTVLLNDGRGHFTELPNALPSKPYGGPSEGLAATPVDLNGDGKLDLLLSYSRMGGPGESFYVGRYIQIAINNGNGTFRDETPSRLPQDLNNNGDWAYGIRVADANGDGKADFLVSLGGFGGTQPLPVYLNNGDGTFAAISVPGAQEIADWADVNGDGRPDIVSDHMAASSSGSDLVSVNVQQAPAKPKPKPKKKPHRHHP